MNDGIIRFGAFRLDRRLGQLFCEDAEVRLRPKAWEVLRYLVERPGELVSLEELLDHCWADLAVSFQSVTNVIYNLRSVLAEHGGDADWIRSVPRRGYRFTAQIEIAPAAAPAAPVPAPPAPAEADVQPSLFVGRRKELGLLDRRWQQALQRDSQVVFVSGEPGIGKTTLVRRFCSSIVQDSQVCVGRCIPQQREAEPYMPVLEALGSLESMKDVVADARDEAPTWLIQMPWLLSREERISLRNSLTDVGPARMLREGRRLLALLGERTPLLLVLEDVHWADKATSDLIHALAQGSQGSRSMLIATFRASEFIIREHPLRDVAIDLSARQPNVALLKLDSLPPQAVHEYLERRFGDAALSEQIGPLLETRSGGNPLFLEALSSYLVEQGRIARKDDKWCVASPTEALDLGLPAGLRDMVRVQLRQIPREQVQLLEAASAAGTDFNSLELAAALELSQDAAEEACREIAQHGQFIRAVDEVTWPDGSVGESYQFSHVTYQQAIRDDMPSSRRRALHGRIGARLAAAYGKRVRGIAPRLVAHFEAAGDMEREFEYLKESVQLASGRYAHRETLAYIERTLEVLRQLQASEDRDLQELGWETERSNLIMDWRGFAAGYECFAQVVELSRRQHNQFLEYCGHIGCATSATFGRGYRDEARAHADAALAIARDDNPQLLSLAHVVVGCLDDTSGDPRSAVEHSEASLAARPDALIGIPRGYDIEIFARVLLAGNLMRLGDLERSRRERELAIACAEERAGAGGKAYALAFVACDALVSLEPELALELADRAIANGRESGLDHFVYAGEAAREAALNLLASDDAIDPAGLDRMAAAIERRRRLGENWYAGLLIAHLADAHRRRGAFETASTLLESAFEEVEPVYLPEIWRIKGELEAGSAVRGSAAARRKGNAAAAECFRAAIEIARGHGTRIFELRSATALARVLHGEDGSRDALAQILRSFPAGLDAADLRAAAEVLEQA